MKRENQIIFISVLIASVISFAFMMMHLSEESHPSGEWQCSNWTDIKEMHCPTYDEASRFCDGVIDPQYNKCTSVVVNKTCNLQTYVRKPK